VLLALASISLVSAAIFVVNHHWRSRSTVERTRHDLERLRENEQKSR
jgi:hypothetical protein